MSLSVAQYIELPEVAGFRDELLEGERILSPDASSNHHALTMRLEKILGRHYRASRFVVLRECSFEVESSGISSIPKPDVMILLKEQYKLSERPFPGPPKYVIEVISPSERPELRQKKIELHFRLGVRGVVEIFLNDGTAIIYRQTGEQPECVPCDGRLKWPFPLDLKSLFANIPKT